MGSQASARGQANVTLAAGMTKIQKGKTEKSGATDPETQNCMVRIDIPMKSAQSMWKRMIPLLMDLASRGRLEIANSYEVGGDDVVGKDTDLFIDSKGQICHLKVEKLRQSIPMACE
ncbi:unnamed protein product [Dovyalis caffra]|uniref:Uncharacterized protein n=1 Tax=Dovyalis caffra TaxID=77055 RepID=A0AAV1S5T4_9ROSI|nr:unnamed protein product [Dovyalis caffra]